MHYSIRLPTISHDGAIKPGLQKKHPPHETFTSKSKRTRDRPLLAIFINITGPRGVMWYRKSHNFYGADETGSVLSGPVCCTIR